MKRVPSSMTRGLFSHWDDYDTENRKLSGFAGKKFLIIVFICVTIHVYKYKCAQAEDDLRAAADVQEKTTIL